MSSSSAVERGRPRPGIMGRLLRFGPDLDCDLGGKSAEGRVGLYDDDDCLGADDGSASLTLDLLGATSLALLLLDLTMMERRRSGLVDGRPAPDMGNKATGTGWTARRGMM